MLCQSLSRRSGFDVEGSVDAALNRMLIGLMGGERWGWQAVLPSASAVAYSFRHLAAAAVGLRQNLRNA